MASELIVIKFNILTELKYSDCIQSNIDAITKIRLIDMGTLMI